MRLCFYLLLGVVFCAWFVEFRTDGFSLAIVDCPFALDYSEAISLEAEQALNQPYRYIGRGRQSFVFASEDGKTVVKFFNKKYINLPWYAYLPLPVEWKEREKSKRALRKSFYLTSYPIAFQELREETGILYLHLGPSQKTLPKLTLIDKASRQFTIDLGQTPFVLQKKMKPLYAALETIYKEQGMDGLRKGIEDFLSLIQTRIEKGIGDRDHDVEHNFGYLDGKAVHLDPGRLYLASDLKEPERLAYEWWSATHRFRDWLKETHPQALAYLDEGR